jgi:hypothetical protein
MATGLAARFAAAADFDFQKLVAQALAEEAVVVYNEVPQGTARTPLQQSRLVYALAVAADPPLQLVWTGAPITPHPRTLAVARILTTQGLDKTSDPVAIQAGVANVWNALAGA